MKQEMMLKRYSPTFDELADIYINMPFYAEVPIGRPRFRCRLRRRQQEVLREAGLEGHAPRGHQEVGGDDDEAEATRGQTLGPKRDVILSD